MTKKNYNTLVPESSQTMLTMSAEFSLILAGNWKSDTRVIFQTKELVTFWCLCDWFFGISWSKRAHFTAQQKPSIKHYRLKNREGWKVVTCESVSSDSNIFGPLHVLWIQNICKSPLKFSKNVLSCKDTMTASGVECSKVYPWSNCWLRFPVNRPKHQIRNHIEKVRNTSRDEL